MENKTTQGLGIKNLLSFPKHDSLNILKIKKQCRQSCQYNINQSRYLCIFRFVWRQMVSSKKVHVQTTQNFSLPKMAEAVIKLNGIFL
jgi:hypothetical protein